MVYHHGLPYRPKPKDPGRGGGGGGGACHMSNSINVYVAYLC